ACTGSRVRGGGRERSIVRGAVRAPAAGRGRLAGGVCRTASFAVVGPRFGLHAQAGPDLDRFQIWGYPPRMSEKTATGHEALLRRHGLHVTAQPLAVPRAVAGRPHLTADEAYQAVQAELGAISRQAVYDALAAFTDRNLLRRIQPGGAPARYENRVGDNHHHLVCRTCNRTVDVDCAVGDAPCLTAADSSGF